MNFDPLIGMFLLFFGLISVFGGFFVAIFSPRRKILFAGIFFIILGLICEFILIASVSSIGLSFFKMSTSAVISGGLGALGCIFGVLVGISAFLLILMAGTGKNDKV